MEDLKINSQDNANSISQKKDSEKIDLIAIFKQLWSHKSYYAIAIGIASIWGLIIAFSIPKTYKTDVVLAPEVSGGSGRSENLSDLAAMVGVKLSVGGSSVDAIYPEIYPQIIGSTPFLLNLFNVKVSSQDKSIENITLYNYVKDHQKLAWWDKIIPGLISIFQSKQPASQEIIAFNKFQLTEEQDGIAKAIKGMIKCNVDKKNSIITISVICQDPLISATVADTVQKNLQQYVVEYRTKKSRNDLEYAQKLFVEAKEQYLKAQQKYTSYADANQELMLESYATKRDQMENEMQLRFNIYNQLAQQVQMARAKIQERTPAFTQIQPATVPIMKDGPRRMTILLGWIFFAIAFTSIFILIKDSRQKN